MNNATQFIIALSTLLAAVAGLINSFRNSGKIKAVSDINSAQSQKLSEIKDQTDGLTNNLAAASLKQGIAEGLATGIAQERVVAKDLLKNGAPK
jgi:hypothetical protein